VISREALSLIERGRRSPRLDQIDAICSIIGVHPLSLLARAYLLKTPEASLIDLFARISSEIDKIEEPPADNPFTKGT
ncbi:helix-turn-helix transcriptional regulator, partial [Pseudomonas aeruginosa]|uniref:helix-turn-helix domain-containing protein n=1 Tax=Pseudomonas aeruginosa TaxID=287 RepID=UPI00352A62E7